MKKFMAMYMAPAATIAEMMKATPEQMKTGMDDWMKWSDAHKKEIVELGAPLGKTKRVTTSGMSDTKNEITGYSIVQGDSFDSVAKIFKGHPHLSMPGTTIDLLECMDMSAMVPA
jgi:hypothetical protein